MVMDGPELAPLTKPQAEVLKFIFTFKAAHIRCPTQVEIARAVGKHESTIKGIVLRLRENNWLIADRTGEPCNAVPTKYAMAVWRATIQTDQDATTA